MELRQKTLKVELHALQIWKALELRHLRYFRTVAEEGSLTLAAAKRLLYVELGRRGEACLAPLPHPVLWIEGDACVAPTEKFCVIPAL